MDVAASEFYGKDKTYDLNFKEEVNFSILPVPFNLIYKDSFLF